MTGGNQSGVIELGLKLLSPVQRTHRILVSAGSAEDKQAILPAVRKMLELGNIELYATPGTHRAFGGAGIPSVLVNKIADGVEPNIETLLREDSFALVVNILTGDKVYDAERSDWSRIRDLVTFNRIPLLTDIGTAIPTLDRLADMVRDRTLLYKIQSDERPWDMRALFWQKTTALGGVCNHHGHFDKSHLITPENLVQSLRLMEDKWRIMRAFKENYTHDDLVERIGRATQKMVDQGLVYTRTMIDADTIIGLKGIEAALEVKEKFKDKIRMDIGVQPLEGVLDPKVYPIYEQACRMADYCGGLPSRDRDFGLRDDEKDDPSKLRRNTDRHLDVILSLAKQLGKPVDVHVDQQNNPAECETEQLADKTIEHGMQGRVFGVHAISVAAKPAAEQDRIIRKVLKADMGIIVCPSAAVSMKHLDVWVPSHNSIAPFVRMKEAGVRVYLGIDNIHDVFMPMVDGDVWTEARMLMESTRDYDMDAVAAWAAAKPVGWQGPAKPNGNGHGR